MTQDLVIEDGMARKEALAVRPRSPVDDNGDDLDPTHLDWRDIPPPNDIVRARRGGHLVRIPKPVVVIEASCAEMRSSYEAFTKARAHPIAVVGSYLALQERWGRPIHLIDCPEFAEELVAHLLTKFYVRHWLQKAGMGHHFQDGDT